jgi:predicted glycosyltransferase involved in capsule biosynthesis
MEYNTSGSSVGGILVVPRIGFEAVGGYDERFTVWGAYDACFTMSMASLWGNPVRFESTIYHLWHPSNSMELFGHPAQRQQQRLTERYTQASLLGPEKMREVRFGKEL